MGNRGRLHRGLVATAVLAGLSWCGVVPVAASASSFRIEHGEPLNNLVLTPGAIMSVSLSRICTPGYSARVRDVPWSVKLDVYRAYGITRRSAGQYEIDHLIPLELGGSNATANLWPELNDHPRGYLNSKDQLENRLHDLVCRGAIALGAAQHQIATDWVALYHRVFGSWPPGVPALRSSTGVTGADSTIAPTPTQPSPVPHGQGVRITALSPVVRPGSHETLRAFTSIAGDTCVLSVVLPSGATSASSGLGTRRADQTGRVTWIWMIGTRTSPGTAHATVRCRAGSVSTTFVVS